MRSHMTFMAFSLCLYKSSCVLDGWVHGYLYNVFTWVIYEKQFVMWLYIPCFTTDGHRNAFSVSFIQTEKGLDL